MKKEYLYYAAAAVIGAVWVLNPARTEAREERVQLSIHGDAAESCAALEVRSKGSVARAGENFTLPGGSNLQIDAGSRGQIRVRGWDQSGYSVEACRFAAAADQAGADQILKSFSVSHTGSRFTVNGGVDGEWLAYFIVRAPRSAALDLETRNGPISVADVSGSIKTRVVNGPVSIQDCGGEIQARATNGPISFAGSGGNVSLTAQNGPVSLRLSGAEWKGAGLDARAVNGPLSLSLPDTYHSGVRIESSNHAPISCRAGVCGSARTQSSGSQRTLELNGSTPLVRLSTQNGPVSVRSPSGAPRMI